MEWRIVWRSCRAQCQRQRGLEAFAAGQGLDTAAGAVVVVDDSQVKARLAALVLGTDALQLVLARRHLHQAGVGVDKDAVEVVHLDVGLQPDLLLAAQGAACRGGQVKHLKTPDGTKQRSIRGTC